MKAITDDLIVRADSTGADGSKLEPEEKLAQRRIVVDADVSVGNGPAGGQATGQKMGAAVTADMTALEAASMFSARCGRCAYWDQRGWEALRKSWSDPSHAEGFTTLNRIRSELLDRAADAILSPEDLKRVEATMREDLAVCRALSEAVREPVITANVGCCPVALEGGAPWSDAFTPRGGGEAAKQATTVYDAILRRAQGRFE